MEMDRRVARTDQAIKDAYFSLIRERGTTRITISEVARRADIDRKTFYLHYDSLKDVLDEYIEKRISHIEALLADTDYLTDPFNVGIIYSIINSANEAELEFLESISASESDNDLWNQISDVLTEKAVEIYKPHTAPEIDEKVLRVYADYFISGALSIYRKWLRGEYEISWHELLKTVREVGEHGLKRVLMITG